MLVPADQRPATRPGDSPQLSTFDPGGADTEDLAVLTIESPGSPLLENAKRRTVAETTAGDLDAAFDNALKKAQVTHEAQATSGT